VVAAVHIAAVHNEPVSGLHARFSALLPRVERHARFAFRAIRCPASRDDAVQEALGLAWREFLRLDRRGIDPARFPRLFARRLVGSVNGGRRTARQDRRNDLLSPRCHLRRGVTLVALGAWPDEAFGPWRESLTDDLKTPVPEQVAFRLDFPAWVRTLKPRCRRMVLDLAAGVRASRVARKYGITLQYLCRLRRALSRHWQAFRDDRPLASLRAARAAAC
jgi:DNA-directed RNA polymerase specialized sigma24 family protein